MAERFRKNWRLKLLSLGLAFALWVAVTGENPVVQDVQVPLAVSVRDEHTISGHPPRVLTVRLRGPEALVRSVESGGLEVVADLRDLAPGVRKKQLSAENVKGIPAGVRVEAIEPDRLTLTLTRKARRSVPVIPSFLGKPPAGYAFYGSRVVPDTVEIEGPEPEIAATSRVRTDPIHLDRATQPMTARVGAVPDNPQIRVVSAATVEVLVEVDAAAVEVVFEDVPIALEGPAHRTRLSPSTVDVTLSGPPRLVGRIGKSQLRVVAEVSGLGPRTRPYRVPLRVDLMEVPPSDLARITVKEPADPMVEIRILDRWAES